MAVDLGEPEAEWGGCDPDIRFHVGEAVRAMSESEAARAEAAEQWAARAMVVIRREIAILTRGSPGLKPDAKNPASGLVVLARLVRGHRNRAAAVAAVDVPERMVYWLERVRRSETLLHGIQGPNPRYAADMIDRYLAHLGLDRDALARIANGPAAGLDIDSLGAWVAETIRSPR